MTPEQAIPRMVAPSQRRHGIWRGGVLQIHITRACDKSCFGCTQGSNLGGKPVMMTPDQFETACKSLEGYWGVVGIFGGNPCLSPHFESICEIFRRYFPYQQRGLWCNHPKGKGAICRATFDPRVSNLNVHLDQEAQDEFLRDWPESKLSLDRLNGINHDSRHSPPFAAIDDVEPDKSVMWSKIVECDVNRYWSAMVCVVRNQVKAYFCELAGAQAMLHADDPDWPDTGVDAVPGWWRQSIQAFAEQIRFHCPKCGIPNRGYGELAINGEMEQVTQTHANIFKPKSPSRTVQLVTLKDQLGTPLDRMTDYIGNGAK